MRKFLLAIFPRSKPRKAFARWLMLHALYWLADITDWVNVRCEAAIIETESSRG